MGERAAALSKRLQDGANALADFAQNTSDAEWKKAVPPDGRPVGIIVHHVASVYPIEIQLAKTLASGKPIAGVSWDDIHKMNAQHAKDHAATTRTEAIDLLRRNAKDAAAAVNALSDQELDRAATVSLNSDAPLTCQYFVEEHALRHSYHHLARIRAALGR